MPATITGASGNARSPPSSRLTGGNNLYIIACRIVCLLFPAQANTARALKSPDPSKQREGGDVHGQAIELSEDALTVQSLTADLQRAGVNRNLFPLVQQHGYLQDLHQEQWEKAELELAQARMLRTRQWHQGVGLTSIQDVIEEGADEDELSLE